jgi:hypothetical protein
VPQPAPAREAYARFTWRDLEPQRGRYDWSAIDAAIADAERTGRRFAFRVRALVSTKGTSVPDYLMEQMSRGWWYDKNGDGRRDSYVPDWNDPDFLERAEALLRALGKRYNGDPRIAWVDIGMFGNWGEWHTYAFPYPSRTGALPMTAANKRLLIDWHIAAFPDTQLVMLSDDGPALRYALEHSSSIGWRRDSFGWDVFDNLQDKPDAWPLARERWKTAPVIVEFANRFNMTDPASYALGLDQAERYHVSLVGNGNMHDWDTLSRAAKQDLFALGKLAGYRLRLRELRLPKVVTPGGSLAISALWQNQGTAPPYEPWQVRYELRDGNGAVRWRGNAAHDLRTVLPDEVQEPHTDRFTLPADLAPGRYTLSIRVEDPAGQRRPMQLALEGGTEGRYDLATLTIR